MNSAICKTFLKARAKCRSTACAMNLPIICPTCATCSTRNCRRTGLFYGKPDSVRRSYGCLAGGILGFAALAFGVLVMAVGDTASALLCLPLAIGVTGVAMFIVARSMPKKTPEGVEAAAKWGAFKAYLETIEKHADLAESGEIFEEYLAYATAFGIEKSWIRKFAAVPTTPIPTWYHPYPPIILSHPAEAMAGAAMSSGRRRWHAQSGRNVEGYCRRPGRDVGGPDAHAQLHVHGAQEHATAQQQRFQRRFFRRFFRRRRLLRRRRQRRVWLSLVVWHDLTLTDNQRQEGIMGKTLGIILLIGGTYRCSLSSRCSCGPIMGKAVFPPARPCWGLPWA